MRPKFFRKKDSDDTEVIINEVPMSTIFRWYLYDTGLSEDTSKLAELVGLSPISEEGESKEEEDSDSRIKKLEPLYSFLDTVSDISASSLTALHLEEAMLAGDIESMEDIEDHKEGMFNVYKAVSLSTLIGAFSIGIELGMIQNNMIRSNVIDIGEIND